MSKTQSTHPQRRWSFPTRRDDASVQTTRNTLDKKWTVQNTCWTKKSDLATASGKTLAATRKKIQTKWRRRIWRWDLRLYADPRNRLRNRRHILELRQRRGRKELKIRGRGGRKRREENGSEMVQYTMLPLQERVTTLSDELKEILYKTQRIWWSIVLNMKKI